MRIFKKQRRVLGFDLELAAAIALIFFSVAFLRSWAGGFSLIASGNGSPVDWQKEYDKLKAKIDKEWSEPHHLSGTSYWASKNLDEYIQWMGIKAGDRARAAELGARAQNAGNPYWYEKFTNLQELAQESGETTLWQGVFIFMRIIDSPRGRADTWTSAWFKASPGVGRRLYEAARQHDFDPSHVRAAAQCLMRFANGDWESGLTGLYGDREETIGDYDAEGYLCLPKRDYDVSCELRDFAHVLDEGTPHRMADKAMEEGEMLRETCDYWRLTEERKDTTDIMDEYLRAKDENWLGSGKTRRVLCEMPPDKGHAFFLKLAEDYDLPKAKEYIEGFYAKLKGKVEYEEEDGKREPAAGAVVTVTDPHDGTEWVVEADDDGNYEIEKVILHKTCGPFPITAEYKGYKEEDEYEGPLEEPNKDFEHEKDLLIRADAWEGTIAGTWEMKAGEDESVLAAIMHCGEYEIGKNWRLRLKFKKDRGNENIVVYALDEARLDFFSESLDMKAMQMEREGQKIEMSGKEKAEARSRKLSKKECGLELAVNLKKKTYALTGKIDVQGIASEGESRLDVKVKPIIVDEREATEGTTGIKEEIEIKGTFNDEKPTRFNGSRNEMDSVLPEFQEFMKALAGKIEWKLSWDLRKKSEK